ncbi:MAG: hypothetical protein M0C28_37095 [Candidatus Moduliflexus flocculans]|nr:hypothetical protein [Candidatus Moduliflexus flocculans]
MNKRFAGTSAPAGVAFINLEELQHDPLPLAAQLLLARRLPAGRRSCHSALLKCQCRRRRGESGDHGQAS